MGTVSQEQLKTRLSWIEEVRPWLEFALDDKLVPTIRVQPTVDPLKFIFKLTFTRPILKGTRYPLRFFLRCWAVKNGCEMPIINIYDHGVQAELLIRDRRQNPNEYIAAKRSKPLFGKGL